MPPAPGHLVVLGDSVPAGNGCGCEPYPVLLGRALSTPTAPVAVTDVGTGGLTTAGLLAQLDDPGLRQSLRSATVVEVTIGANDFDDALAGQPRCAAAGSTCFAGPTAALPGLLGTGAAEVRDLAPGARVLVTGYWDVFLDGAVGRAQGSDYVQTSDALTRQVDGLVQAAAVAAGATYVDVYGPFESRSPAGLTALLAPDGDHPSASGHALLAQLLLAAVRGGELSRCAPAHRGRRTRSVPASSRACVGQRPVPHAAAALQRRHRPVAGEGEHEALPGGVVARGGRRSAGCASSSTRSCVARRSARPRRGRARTAGRRGRRRRAPPRGWRSGR